MVFRGYLLRKSKFRIGRSPSSLALNLGVSWMQDIILFISDMISQGYLGLLIICFIINMIPFLSPSNMVLAGAAMLLLPSFNPIIVGVVVAISATAAKLIHFYIVRGSRAVLSDERIASLDSEKHRVEKWGALALFIAAASPVPDDPLIVYVGFVRYSSAKFLVSYFVGKVTVTILGALIGYSVGSYFESMPIVLASIALTALITGFLFKRKTEGKESDMLQDIIETEIFDDESESEKRDGQDDFQGNNG
jgi:membrane protein YqaA with SNARE-associated domain